MVFLFTKKIILFFIRKNETCLSRKNTWKYDIFCKFSEKMVFLIQWQWNMVFLVLSGKIIFIFLKNMILLFRKKMKDHLSQKQKKNHGNMIFSVYSVKMVFLSPINMISLFCPKSKHDILPIEKMTFPVSMKKMIFILENFVFILIQTLKMIKTFTQSNTHRKN